MVSLNPTRSHSRVGAVVLVVAIAIAAYLALAPRKAPEPERNERSNVAHQLAPSSQRSHPTSREPTKLAERCSVRDNTLDAFVALNIARIEKGEKSVRRVALRVLCVQTACELQMLDLAGLDKSGMLTGHEMQAWEGNITKRDEGLIGIRVSGAGEHVVVIDSVKQHLFYRRRTAEFEDEGSSTCGVTP